MKSYEGTFTDLDGEEWSLFEFGYRLDEISFSDVAIWIAWSEEGQRCECELKPKTIDNVECWVGSLLCAGLDEGDGELIALRYDTADGGALLIGTWILGDTNGRCTIEITPKEESCS